MQLIYLKPTSTSMYVVYILELKNTARRNCPVMCLQHLADKNILKILKEDTRGPPPQKRGDFGDRDRT